MNGATQSVLEDRVSRSAHFSSLRGAGIPVIPDDYVRFIDRPSPGGDVAALLSMADELGDVAQGVEWSDDDLRTTAVHWAYPRCESGR